MGRLVRGFRFDAVVSFIPRFDDFKPHVYSIDGKEEKVTHFEVFLKKCNLIFPVDIDLNDPVQVELLEEFKAMCKKTVKFRYYEYGVNWFDKLVKIADEIKGEKWRIDLIRKSEFVTSSFGEREGVKYLILDDFVLLVFRDRSKWGILDEYEEACKRKLEEVRKEYMEEGMLYWESLKPTTKYYLDENSVIEWLMKYASKTGVPLTGDINIEGVPEVHGLTADKLENICLKRVFRKTVAVEFEDGLVRIFFITRGVRVELPKEGEPVEELKRECSKEVEYEYYPEYPSWKYRRFLSYANRVETYGNVVKVFHSFPVPDLVEAAFGEKNGEKHVIFHKYRAFVHFIFEGENAEEIEELESEESESKREEGEKKRYYMDEDYMLDWIKKYIETIGPIEVVKTGRKKAKIKLTLENFDKIFAKKRTKL